MWTHPHSHVARIFEIVVVFLLNDVLALMLNCLVIPPEAGCAKIAAAFGVDRGRHMPAYMRFNITLFRILSL